jgi:hypothetical protein
VTEEHLTRESTCLITILCRCNSDVTLVFVTDNILNVPNAYRVMTSRTSIEMHAAAGFYKNKSSTTQDKVSSLYRQMTSASHLAPRCINHAPDDGPSSMTEQDVIVVDRHLRRRHALTTRDIHSAKKE